MARPHERKRRVRPPRGYASAQAPSRRSAAPLRPGATNIVNRPRDAMMDSIPIVRTSPARYTSKLMGDAFQAERHLRNTPVPAPSTTQVKKLEGELPNCPEALLTIAAAARPGRFSSPSRTSFRPGPRPNTPVNSIHLPGYKVLTERRSHGTDRRAATDDVGAETPQISPAAAGIVLGQRQRRTHGTRRKHRRRAHQSAPHGLGGMASKHISVSRMQGMHGS